MGARYLTSDWHFWHPLMTRLRGFTSDGQTVTPADLEAHNAEIIRRHNKVVRYDDDVWFLGDATIGQTARIWPLIAQMNGKIHVVWGNHDDGFAGCRHAHLVQKTWHRHVASVQDHAMLRTAKGKVMLSHFPYAYEPDRNGKPASPRYLEHRLHDNGLPLFHGHTHENRKVTSDHEVHVGLDAWDLTPVSENDAVALIGQAP